MSSHNPNFTERFNSEQRQELNHEAVAMRERLLSAAFRAFQEFYIEDYETQQQTNQKKYRLWLSKDSLAIPNEVNEFQESVAYALQSPLQADQSYQRLRFHTILPDTFDHDDFDDFERLETPKKLFVEQVRYVGAVATSQISRCAIDKDHTYMYQTAADAAGEELVYPDNTAVWDEFNQGFNSGIGLIVELNEKLINWKAVKQRLVVVSDNGDRQARDI